MVSRSLVQDLQNSSAFKVDVPELALETTVLNRLAVLEALCASQAHTITWLQAEINDLRSSLAASAPVESKIRMPMEDPTAQHSYEVPADAVSSLGEQAVQQTATSGRPPAMLRTRVHTLNDPSTALQPLSREEFVAKLPKVVLKAGQILPIQNVIRALLTDASGTGMCNPASDADVQKLSATVASVLLHNQDLIASFSPASDKGSHSLAKFADHCQNRQSVEQAVNSALGHSHSDQLSNDHGEMDVSRNQSTMLTGSIEGPEIFEQHDNDGRHSTNANSTLSSPGSARPEEDVGCNSVINFFLAEMLGGNAE